jgi:hypothetical protein
LNLYFFLYNYIIYSNMTSFTFIVFICFRWHQWIHSLQSEKKFFKSQYFVNTIIARQWHIIQLFENFTYFKKNAKQKCKLHKKALLLISIENTMGKINVSKCCFPLYKTGWTTYVIHPGMFSIENFITTNLYDKSQTKLPYGLEW